MLEFTKVSMLPEFITCMDKLQSWNQPSPCKLKAVPVDSLCLCPNKPKPSKKQFLITGVSLIPGLPMFFNISHGKLGRPGQSGDVMDVGSLSPPIRPCNLVHVEKLASTVNGTAAQCTSQGIRVKRTVSKTTTKGAQDRCCT